MKKTLIPILTLLLSGCYTQYPTTTFWINNNTDKTVNFRASIIKYSSMGPYKMTLPFTIEPNDSVLFRQVGFHKNGNPARVFSEINFFPLDPKTNNPSDSTNWIKSLDQKGKPKYNFFIYPVNK